MFYQIIGEGKNIVLLHGWGFNSNIMKKLANILALTYRVITIDLPGYGMNWQQSCPDTLLELADALRKIIPEQSILIGWSLGGLVALQLALKNKFEKIYVIAGTPCFVTKENWPAMSEITLNKFLNQVDGNIASGLDVFLYLNLQGGNNDKASYKQLKNLLGRIPRSQILIDGLKILATADLRNDLENINCPIQFILAENDHLINIEIAEKLPLYSEKIEVITLKNTNHAMVYFNAELIANMIIN